LTGEETGRKVATGCIISGGRGDLWGAKNGSGEKQRGKNRVGRGGKKIGVVRREGGKTEKGKTIVGRGGLTPLTCVRDKQKRGGGLPRKSGGTNFLSEHSQKFKSEI